MTTLPKGYIFSAAQAGFKKPGRYDLAAIISETPATAAGVFTTNLFQAAPVLQCKAMLDRSRKHSAFLINSGQANACTGNEGLQDCRETLNIVGKALNIPADEILPASTGVIGPRFDLNKWHAAMTQLEANKGTLDLKSTAQAIMTTDSFPKTAYASAKLEQGEVFLAGICKGAGMISPNMATMLGFIICDAMIAADAWQSMLSAAVNVTFNRITVDGDTSTNDSVMALANGASGISATSQSDIAALSEALTTICRELSYMIVQDAEGGTKVAHIVVSGAPCEKDAELIARAIGNSPLVKTALFGCDPNWGRIVAAAGRSGACFDPDKLVLKIGDIVIFENGKPAAGDMDTLLAPVMAERDVPIKVELHQGTGTCTLWASDLTHEYISINADYRT